MIKKSAVTIMGTLMLAILLCVCCTGDEAFAKENNVLIGLWGASGAQLPITRSPGSMNDWTFKIETIEFFSNGRFVALCSDRLTATGNYYICDNNTLILHSDYVGNGTVIYSLKKDTLVMDDYRTYYEKGLSEPSSYLYKRIH